jgi:hypothetical protein
MGDMFLIVAYHGHDGREGRVKLSVLKLRDVIFFDLTLNDMTNVQVITRS